ncbi:MAG: hypothetical protein JWL65_6173 [Gammaproteobacteria bacterium]|nr:hypothetical protein [Gammaproteobacteria bacterium]
MFGSDILEVATGVVFVFVLISTICTAMRESLEAWLKTRASYLEFGIRELLQDRKGTGLAKGVFEHPLVFGLYSGNYTPRPSEGRPIMWKSGGNLPSYIPSANFALALMDIAARGPVNTGAAPSTGGSSLSLAQIRAHVGEIGNPQVQRALLTAIDSAQGDFDRARSNIEAWYDSAMDRVSGWYKRSTQWCLFWVALILAAGLNINTITIADYLYRHDAERSALVSTIDKTAATAQTSETYKEAKDELGELRLPMGWSDGWGAPRTHAERQRARGSAPIPTSTWQDVIAPVLGWIFTAFAATLGAPFWFDVLNQIMVIRSTVKPHEKSGWEASLDRQTKPPSPQPTLIATVPQMAANQQLDSNDLCGVGEIIATPDDQLPPALGGVS